MKYLLILFTALISVTASAVQFSHDDSGDVILFPIATTNEGLQTLLTVSNDDLNRFTAVRMRLRAVDHAAIELLMMIPGGASWTAAMADGRMLTDGSICALSGDGSPLPRELELSASELLVEIYESGSWHPLDPLSNHEIGDDGCPLIDEIAMDPPDGHLRAQAIVVDVARGISASVAPTVLREFSSQVLYEPGTTPDTDGLDLGRANPPIAVLNIGTTAVTTTWSDGLAAVEALLASDYLEADFTIETNLNAGTEWVIGLPTLQDTSLGTFVISARRRDGSEELATAKCSPSVGPPGPVADRLIQRVRLGSREVLGSGGTAAVHADVRSQFCGFVNQDLLESQFHSGRVRVSSLFFLFSARESIEGVRVGGIPAIAASISVIENGDLNGVRAQYAWSNNVDRQQSVTGITASALKPQACREFDSARIYLSLDETVLAVAQPTELLLLDPGTLDEIQTIPALVNAGLGSAIYYREPDAGWNLARLSDGGAEIFPVPEPGNSQFFSADGTGRLFTDDDQWFHEDVSSGSLTQLAARPEQPLSADGLTQLIIDDQGGLVRIDVVTGSETTVTSLPDLGSSTLSASLDLQSVLLVGQTAEHVAWLPDIDGPVQLIYTPIRELPFSGPGSGVTIVAGAAQVGNGFATIDTPAALDGNLEIRPSATSFIHRNGVSRTLQFEVDGQPEYPRSLIFTADGRTAFGLFRKDNRDQVCRFDGLDTR